MNIYITINELFANYEIKLWCNRTMVRIKFLLQRNRNCIRDVDTLRRRSEEKCVSLEFLSKTTGGFNEEEFI